MLGAVLEQFHHVRLVVRVDETKGEERATVRVNAAGSATRRQVGLTCRSAFFQVTVFDDTQRPT